MDSVVLPLAEEDDTFMDSIVLPLSEKDECLYGLHRITPSGGRQVSSWTPSYYPKRRKTCAFMDSIVLPLTEGEGFFFKPLTPYASVFNIQANAQVATPHVSTLAL